MTSQGVRTAVRATVATALLDPAHRELERRGEKIASRASESGLALLARYGFALRSFSDLNQRIPHELALELLDNAIRVTRDATFPLSAGANAQRGDFGAVDYAALSAPTLRDSIAPLRATSLSCMTAP